MKTLAIALITLFLAPFLNSSSRAFADDETCHAQASKIGEFINGYRDAAFVHNAALAEQNYLDAQELIFVKNQGDAECQQSLMFSYVFDTILLTKPLPEDKKKKNNLDLDFFLTSQSLFSHGEEISILFRLLYEAHQIKFLTEDFRQNQKGHWLNKSNGRQYVATGGYDCGTTTIYVDPTLRPIDEALAIYHEMSHLVRDKTTQQINPEFIHDGKIDWQAYNLDDEVSGVLFSAASQADMQGLSSKTKNNSSYQVPGDLTFFSDSGLLYNIFKANHSEACFLDSSRKNCVFRSQSLRSETNQILVWELLLGANQSFKPAQMETYSEIRKTIWDGYFSDADAGNVVPSQPKLRKPEYGMGIDEFFMNNESKFATTSPGINMVVNPLLRSKSYVCSLYENDMSKGNITHYLGSEFEDSTAPATAAKALIKPCLRFSNKL